MNDYEKEIVKVLEEYAYHDDYGDLNISEQDYPKIAKSISEIPCEKYKERNYEMLEGDVEFEGIVDYELDPLGMPYNCNVGTVSIEDIITEAVNGKRGTNVKISIHKCKESK